MIGDHGPNVAQIQRRLIDLGVAPDLAVDGNYLETTAQAVLQFQTKNSIPRTNGRLFPFTLKAMGLLVPLPGDDL
jgi:peptidoglycan hydrolase-like protein with peptidoglycan-binding domain